MQDPDVAVGRRAASPRVDPAQSTATPSVAPEAGRRRSRGATRSSTALVAASSSSRPAWRARSTATTGPRNGVSAATRPSSRAMIATSTPDASGPSSSPGPAELEPARTARGVGEPLAPDGVVEIVDRPRPEVGDERRRRCAAARAARRSTGCPSAYAFSVCRVNDARPRARSVSFSTLPAGVHRQLVDELDRRAAPCSWPSRRVTTR